MRDLLILRVGDHLAERAAIRVPHEQNGVPLLTFFRDER
jgi:hypothetical protein